MSKVTVVSDVDPPSSAQHAVRPAQAPKEANPERGGRERRWPTCNPCVVARWGRHGVNIMHGTPEPSQRRRVAPALPSRQLCGRTTHRRIRASGVWSSSTATEPAHQRRTRSGWKNRRLRFFRAVSGGRDPRWSRRGASGTWPARERAERNSERGARTAFKLNARDASKYYTCGTCNSNIP